MSCAYNKGKKNRRILDARKPKRGHQTAEGHHAFRNFDKLAPLKEFLASRPDYWKRGN